MAAIPYGVNGLMISLRSGHDGGDCWVCAPPPGWDYWQWQRGCPTSDLPIAPLWRAHQAVTEAHHAVTGDGPQAAELGRAQQLTRWHVDDQVELVEQRGQNDAAQGGAA